MDVPSAIRAGCSGSSAGVAAQYGGTIDFEFAPSRRPRTSPYAFREWSDPERKLIADALDVLMYWRPLTRPGRGGNRRTPPVLIINDEGTVRRVTREFIRRDDDIRGNAARRRAFQEVGRRSDVRYGKVRPEEHELVSTIDLKNPQYHRLDALVISVGLPSKDDIETLIRVFRQCMVALPSILYAGRKKDLNLHLFYLIWPLEQPIVRIDPEKSFWTIEKGAVQFLEQAMLAAKIATRNPSAKCRPCAFYPIPHPDTAQVVLLSEPLSRRQLNRTRRAFGRMIRNAGANFRPGGNAFIGKPLHVKLVRNKFRRDLLREDFVPKEHPIRGRYDSRAVRMLREAILAKSVRAPLAAAEFVARLANLLGMPSDVVRDLARVMVENIAWDKEIDNAWKEIVRNILQHKGDPIPPTSELASKAGISTRKELFNDTRWMPTVTDRTVRRVFARRRTNVTRRNIPFYHTCMMLMIDAAFNGWVSSHRERAKRTELGLRRVRYAIEKMSKLGLAVKVADGRWLLKWSDVFSNRNVWHMGKKGEFVGFDYIFEISIGGSWLAKYHNSIYDIIHDAFIDSIRKIKRQYTGDDPCEPGDIADAILRGFLNGDIPVFWPVCLTVDGQKIRIDPQT